MSKFGTFGDYPKESLPSAEAALLTAWRSLERYHNGLVTGYEFALKALQKDFSEADQDGPIRAAEFHLGNAEDRGRVRQSVATVGRMLLGT